MKYNPNYRHFLLVSKMSTRLGNIVHGYSKYSFRNMIRKKYNRIDINCVDWNTRTLTYKVYIFLLLSSKNMDINGLFILLFYVENRHKTV